MKLQHSPHLWPDGRPWIVRVLVYASTGLFVAAAAMSGVAAIGFLLWGLTAGPLWLRWAIGIPIVLTLLTGLDRLDRWRHRVHCAGTPWLGVAASTATRSWAAGRSSCGSGPARTAPTACRTANPLAAGSPPRPTRADVTTTARRTAPGHHPRARGEHLMERHEYPKIYGPFKRHTDGPNRNQLIWGEWTMPEFGALAGVDWTWTEKVDGTNIRIFWDGHKVAYGGRTDAAQIPTSLLTALDDMFPEELLEQTFGGQEVTLYGEGYGAKIQKGGGNYKADGQSFTLFDVRIDRWWLERDNVAGIAKSLGITAVPECLGVGTVNEALRCVNDGLTSMYGDFPAEGLVGTAPCGLLTRAGQRIQMKVKHADIYHKVPESWLTPDHLS